MGRTSDGKQRLIAAMAELVHRRGYTDVGVDEVCKAAGVRKGSFYYFFKSKRDLMLAALDQHWSVGRQHFGAAFLSEGTPLERIERLFALLATAETSNHKNKGHVLGCPFGNIAAEVGTSDRVLARRADEAFCGLAGLLRGALTDARARGQLAQDVDLQEAADALVAYFEGIALLAKTRNDPSLIRRLGRRAVRLAIEPAIRPAPPRETARNKPLRRDKKGV